MSVGHCSGSTDSSVTGVETLIWQIWESAQHFSIGVI
jgi:hypothetical protein